RSADAAGADLDPRLHIVERIVEDSDRLALEARFHALERAIDDPFGDRLLAVEHDGIHEFGEHHIPELRIGENLALLGTATTSHWTVPFSSAFSGTRPGLTIPLHFVIPAEAGIHVLLAF